MKKLMIVLLFVFAVNILSTNMVFAGEPILEVDVKLGKNPGGSVVFKGKTGGDGKFACKLEEGNYELQLSYDQIKRILSAKDKNFASNPDIYVIESFFDVFTDISIFDRWGKEVKAPGKLIINKESEVIKIKVSKGGGTLKGTLSYSKINNSK